MSPRWLHWPAAAGPSLIVWDDFTGSAGASITGRTPNQVNTPGNTWLTQLSAGYYKIAASGIDACAASENGISGMFIDVGTTSFSVEAKSEIISTAHPWTWRNGIIIGYNNSTREFSHIVIGDNGTSLVLGDYDGSTYTSTTLASFSALPTGELDWVIGVSGTSVTYGVSQSGSSIASGTTTVAYSNGFPGWWSRRNDVNNGCILKDFKVYA